MLKNPSEVELLEFFEEVWTLAERTAASPDHALAARLFELAEDVALWCNDVRLKRLADC